MTQKEFEDLTGLKVEAEEYAAINSMYMLAGEMDKTEFCKRWRQTGKNPLTQSLAETGRVLQSQLEKRQQELKEIKERERDLAHSLLKSAYDYRDSYFRFQAVELIGEREVVRLTLEKGYQPLFQEDRRFLMSMMEDREG